MTLHEPCAYCPHPEVCLAGRPYCENLGEMIELQTPEASGGEPLKPTSVRHLKGTLRWPMPNEGEARRNPTLGALSIEVIRLLSDDGKASPEECDRRHRIIANAVNQAFQILQGAAFELQAEEKLGGMALYAAAAASAGLFLGTTLMKDARKHGGLPGEAVTAAFANAFSNYAYMIAMDLVAQEFPEASAEPSEEQKASRASAAARALAEHLEGAVGVPDQLRDLAGEYLGETARGVEAPQVADLDHAAIAADIAEKMRSGGRE